MQKIVLYFLYRCLREMLGTLLLLLAELHTCRNIPVAILCKSLCLPFLPVKAFCLFFFFYFYLMYKFIQMSLLDLVKLILF